LRQLVEPQTKLRRAEATLPDLLLETRALWRSHAHARGRECPGGHEHHRSVAAARRPGRRSLHCKSHDLSSPTHILFVFESPRAPGYPLQSAEARLGNPLPSRLASLRVHFGATRSCETRCLPPPRPASHRCTKGQCPEGED